MSEQEPVVVYETPDPTAAECIRQALASQDISCHLFNANANKMIGIGINLEIRIVVPSGQADRASHVIKEFFKSK
ncbi:MAG: DUF2007 domain-containing protein [Elusimicrobia bacterium]|nr:DUF2007 domain-containing protein [Elusimicrobiota bacterium]